MKYPVRALAYFNIGQLETYSWTGWHRSPCLCVPIVLFLTSSRCQWVSPKSSHPCPHCACSPHPHLHPHVEGLESLNKDAQRLRSLEPCHRVKLSCREGRLQTGEPRRFSPETRTAILVICATWNWRNLFRTLSARSGATAPCRKLHGRRTKVSVLHPHTMLVPPPGAQEERGIVPVFPAYVSLREHTRLTCDSQRFGTF